MSNWEFSDDGSYDSFWKRYRFPVDGHWAISADKDSDIIKALTAWIKFDPNTMNPVSLALQNAGHTKYPLVIVVGPPPFMRATAYVFNKDVGYVIDNGIGPASLDTVLAVYTMRCHCRAPMNLPK
jgi:hypothetical protein